MQWLNSPYTKYGGHVWVISSIYKESTVVHENIKKFWTSLLSSEWIIWSWLWEKLKIMQQINKCIDHDNTHWIKYALDLFRFRVYMCKYPISLT